MQTPLNASAIVGISIIISVIIDLCFLKYVKTKKPILNLIMGFQIFILGLFMFYLSYTTIFYLPFSNTIPYIVSTYIATTGLFLSIISYVKSE